MSNENKVYTFGVPELPARVYKFLERNGIRYSVIAGDRYEFGGVFVFAVFSEEDAKKVKNGLGLTVSCIDAKSGTFEKTV